MELLANITNEEEYKKVMAILNSLRDADGNMAALTVKKMSLARVPNKGREDDIYYKLTLILTVEE